MKPEFIGAARGVHWHVYELEGVWVLRTTIRSSRSVQARRVSFETFPTRAEAEAAIERRGAYGVGWSLQARQAMKAT